MWCKNKIKKVFKKFAHVVENLYLCIAFEKKGHSFGRLAQLVQSICLTSRGSAVRIRQRPPNNQPFLFKNNESSFRAFSSAGSEHLPYKQRVGGSNPSTPTLSKALHVECGAFFVSRISFDNYS